MRTRMLAEDERTRLTTVYRRSRDKAIRHDAVYLANIRRSFFDKMIGSDDQVAKKVGKYAKVIQDYLIDWRDGKMNAPWETVAAFTAAMNYIVNPMDLIPDTVPEAGYLDDLFVLELALEQHRQELDEYSRSHGVDI